MFDYFAQTLHVDLVNVCDHRMHLVYVRAFGPPEFQKGGVVGGNGIVRGKL